MNEILKKELKDAFEVPPPMHKKEFLQQLHKPGIGVQEFVILQVGYIRKWVWAVSALIFMVSLVGAVMLSVDMLWSIAAFTPLLALAIISESGRSENCEMAELEMATRFSLRSVVLARLGILGIENLVLLALLLPLGLWNNLLKPIQAGIYILVPYLLTTWVGLWVLRKYRNKEAMYFCSGVAACISILSIFFHDNFLQAYQDNFFGWWCAGAALLGIGVVKQYINIIKGTEELIWSL